MSLYSAKTGVSSILKTFSPAERDRAKNAAINKVRFEMPKRMGVLGALDAVINKENFSIYNEFIAYLKEAELQDAEFLKIVSEARKSVHLLKPTFALLAECLLSLKWLHRDKECLNAYAEFVVDLLVAHSKYIKFGIRQLVATFVPRDDAELSWTRGTPTADVCIQVDNVHALLERLLTVIPMTFDVVLEFVEYWFPYYKKLPHVIGGYLHNILRILDYKPAMTNYMIELIFKHLLLLDVNAPRSEIEDALEVEDEENENPEEDIFAMEGCSDNEKDDEDKTMPHPVAETLDICMEKMFGFLNQFKSTPSDQLKSKGNNETIQLFKIVLGAFENVILPSHNTHHVQFIIYYFCNFKTVFAEKFLSTMWNKARDPNEAASIRQASVGYIASFLARSKGLSIILVKNYLSEFCNWTHQYISRTDSIRSNISLKANIVFFSVCQAIFYVIAFRSRDLTVEKKDILFLQTLQLSALVTSTYNPLRVCLPAVATAFAGVTRAYQLAYCHTILERNARRKLATVYANDIATPEEILETFFPFDPYLLKKSGKRITPLYLQYQASEAEEEQAPIGIRVGRKRGDSEMIEDFDDFIATDKRQKFSDLAKSVDKEMQFTYGLSPGFQM